MGSRNVQITIAAMEAFNRRDLDALRALYAPDIVASAGPLWPAAGEVTGRTGLLGAYAEIFDVFAVNEVVPDEVVELEDDVVLAAIRWRGAVSEGDVVAEQQLVCVCRLGDELLLQIDWYATRAEALAAVGTGTREDPSTR